MSRVELKHIILQKLELKMQNQIDHKDLLHYNISFRDGIEGRGDRELFHFKIWIFEKCVTLMFLKSSLYTVILSTFLVIFA